MAKFDLLTTLSLQPTSFTDGINRAKASVQEFTGVINAVAGVMAVAFSVKQIISFGTECIELAANAEGVRNAFMKIGDSTKVLNDLKTATRGALSETTVMTLAEKAQSFNIPMKDLAVYLDFATKKAIQTGQSIDELTEKIVQGVGRNTPRSFAALGISMAESKKAIAEHGNILDLVIKKLKEMGDVGDTTAIKIAKMQANVNNLKVAWGNYLNQSTAVQGALEGTALTLKRLADPNLDFWQKWMWSGKQYQKWFEEKGQYLTPDGKGGTVNTQMSGGRTPEQFNQMVNTAPSPIITKAPEAIVTINSLRLSLKVLEDEFDSTDMKDKKLTASLRDQIQAMKDLITEVETGEHVFNKMDMAKNKANPILPADMTEVNKTAGSVVIGALVSDYNDKNNKLAPSSKRFNADSEKGIEKATKKANQALEEQGKIVSDTLMVVFDTLFQSIHNGFKGVLQAFGQMLEQMVEKLLAKAAVFAILSLLSGGSGGLAKAAGKAKGGGFFDFLLNSHANGGQITGDQWSMVGERGQELVHLPSGSQVFSNQQSMGMMGGNGGVQEIRLRADGRDLVGVIKINGRIVNSYA